MSPPGQVASQSPIRHSQSRTLVSDVSPDWIDAFYSEKTMFARAGATTFFQGVSARTFILNDRSLCFSSSIPRSLFKKASPVYGNKVLCEFRLRCSLHG